MTGSLGERICSRIGEQPASGLSRRAPGYLSPRQKAAELVAQWMREAGMSVRVDAVGNVVGRRDGLTPQTPALLIGSTSTPSATPAGSMGAWALLPPSRWSASLPHEMRNVRSRSR